MMAARVSSPLVPDCGRVAFEDSTQADHQGNRLVAVTRQRQLRPTSAKATKHKRVADNHEKSIVYEDCEDSEPDVYDGDHDTFETDVPLTGGRDYVHRHPLLGDNQLYHKLAIARARAIVNAGPSRDRASTIPPLQYLL
jgi:hypothetical protein